MSEFRARYEIESRKVALVGVALTVLLFSIFAVSLCLGPYTQSLREVFAGLMRGDAVLWNVRVARIVTATMVGASLAVGGAVTQCVLRNPLATPFTLGVASGAVFGAAVAIVLLGAGKIYRTGEVITFTNPYLISLFAFAGSLISVSVVIALSKIRGLRPEAMVLAGVAMASFFQASLMLVQYFATSEIIVASIVFWAFGDVGKATWKEIPIIFAVFIPSMLYFLYRRWDYNALTLGDETARSLGIKPEKVRLETMLIAALLTAVCVAFTGIIGFVCLVAPHSIRLLLGGSYEYLVPLSAVLGAAILLAADTLGRIVISPVEIPVGIITSFIGAPMFIYLILKTGRG